METRIALSSPGAPVEMARCGTFRALKGGNVTLTPAMLAEIAENSTEPVPMKLGHEEMKTSDPDIGRVENVRIENGALVGDASPTDHGRSLNRSGAFRHCSPELEKTSRGWKLTALGLLGAWPPADRGKRALALGAARSGERLVLLGEDVDLAEPPRRPAVSEESIRTAMRGFQAMNPSSTDAEAREAVFLALDHDAAPARRSARVALAASQAQDEMTQRCRELMARNAGMTFVEAASRLYGNPQSPRAA